MLLCVYRSRYYIADQIMLQRLKQSNISWRWQIQGSVSFRNVFIPNSLHSDTSSIRKLNCTISGLSQGQGCVLYFRNDEAFFRNDDPQNYFRNDEPSEIGHLHFGMKTCQNDDWSDENSDVSERHQVPGRHKQSLLH